MATAAGSYEAERAERVARNRARLAELGLGGGAGLARLGGGGGGRRGGPPRPKPAKRRRAEASPPPPRERSKRLRSLPAGRCASYAELDELDRALGSSGRAERGEGKAPPPAPLLGETRGRVFKGRKAGLLHLLESAEAGGGFRLQLPVTLSCKRGAGTTVWALGTIHRGELAPRYWSSPGALYHHIYPVGYKATKTHFGRDYAMDIEEGAGGPVFKVTDLGTGRAFAGPTPTKPWTDVCLSLNTGARISGPLFFGFSDPAVQLAIAALYTPEERAAALGGRSWKPGADVRTGNGASAGAGALGEARLETRGSSGRGNSPRPATPGAPVRGRAGTSLSGATPPGVLVLSRERVVARVFLVRAR